MGTSKSYGGPADISRLLPAWALPADAPPVAADPSQGGGDPAVAPADPAARPPAAPGVASPAAAPAPTSWRSARTAIGKAVHGTGSGSSASGRRDYRATGRRYVAARGGAKKAAQGAVAGRRATAALAGFLSSIPSSGFTVALDKLGLADLAGQSVDAVLAAITNALSPQGATLEEAAARHATAETLADLYEKWGAQDGGLERLQDMTPDDVRGAVKESVSSYVFHRWALDLGAAIERGAVSAKQAVTMEREMRQYIRDTLVLELRGTDVLSVDWSGHAGRDLVEKIYQDAYALIETKL